MQAQLLQQLLQQGGRGNAVGAMRSPGMIGRNTEAIRRGYASPTLGNIGRGLSLGASFMGPLGIASTLGKTALGMPGGLPGVGGVKPFEGSISFGSLSPQERAMVERSTQVGQTPANAFQAVERARALTGVLSSGVRAGGGRDISQQGRGGFQGATADARRAGAFGDRGGGRGTGSGGGRGGSSRGARGE